MVPGEQSAPKGELLLPASRAFKRRTGGRACRKSSLKDTSLLHACQFTRASRRTFPSCHLLVYKRKRGPRFEKQTCIPARLFWRAGVQEKARLTQVFVKTTILINTQHPNRIRSSSLSKSNNQTTGFLRKQRLAAPVRINCYIATFPESASRGKRHMNEPAACCQAGEWV
jgi:hypothetical protein